MNECFSFRKPPVSSGFYKHQCRFRVANTCGPTLFNIASHVLSEVPIKLYTVLGSAIIEVYWRRLR